MTDSVEKSGEHWPRVLTRSKFLRNWSYLVLSNIFGQILGMLATIRVARALSPDGYGSYNVILTISALGVIVLGLGLRNVVIRECARFPEKSRSLFLASILLRAVLLPVVCLGVFLYARSSSLALTFDLTSVCIGVLIAGSAWELIESVAFGHERMGHSASVNLIGAALWSVMVWGMPEAWITVFSISFLYMALQAAKALAFAFVARGYLFMNGGLPAIAWNKECLTVTRQSMPFYWLALLTAATSSLPILFLAELSSQTEVGYYNLGYKLVNPMQMFIVTALVALYPGLSKDSMREPERFSRIVRESLIGITILGAGAGLCVSFLRNEIVAILFGAAYAPAADAMAFQVWGSVFAAIYWLIGTTLAAGDRQNLLALLSTGYACLSLPLVYWGSKNGATGLAVATVGGALVNMPYHWIAFQKALPRRVEGRSSLFLLALLSLSMAASVILPPVTPLGGRITLVAGLAGGMCYWVLSRYRHHLVPGS